MDPLTLSTITGMVSGGSNILGTGLRTISDIRRRRLARKGYKEAYGAAKRNVAQAAEDIPRGRRRLEESLAARGLEDSSIAESEKGYYDRRAERLMADLQARQKLARERYRQHKRLARLERISDLLGLIGGAGRAMGAVSEISGEEEV